MKAMMVKKGTQHFHDDQLSDGDIIINPFYRDVETFNDFRFLNGLPIDVADEFVAQLHDIFNDIAISQKKYKDYYKTHPNPLSTKEREFI